MSRTRRMWAVPLIGGLTAAVMAVPLQAVEKASVRFKVTNTSGKVVREIYVSPPSTSKWGPNLLKKPLNVNETVELKTKGGCGRYDIRLVADDRTEYLDEEVDFCEDDEELQVSEREVKKVKH